MTITLNPDKEYVAEVRKAIKNNNGYCPCAPIKTQDTRCMCKEFRDMDEGACHCGLYMKKKD